MTVDTNVPTVIEVSSLTGLRSGEVETPHGQPNICVKVVNPFVILGLSALVAYIEGVIALVTIGLAAPRAMPTSDFLSLVMLSASLAFAPVAVSVGKDFTVIIKKLIARYSQS